MIEIKKASKEHIEGISWVCSEGNKDTYRGIRSKENIERNNRIFYNYDRIENELSESEGWDGYIVAIENKVVIGAIGGGMVRKDTSEVYVLYLDPKRRREGTGTRLLNYLTNIQLKKGSKEQWVSVQKGNVKGIPFYEARGFKNKYEKKEFSNASYENYVSLRYARNI